ncbi:fusaric acid resistance protein [Pseudomonas alcaligenes]|uniref:Fusaric acid resistance protein n=1 Tax=Aquipseudomonas alcaligenes TaxID=43263 RepID=A0ABR7S3J0_AQUAC|nr:FUSC family protein [Pseudomonas alcaligenes]MBC9251602.1 fusaric acid resistance protein [Pseudomonas alcaligenes]
MRDSLSVFLSPSRMALQFACKTLLGGALALWCAFRFGLEQPQWALMTAFIVAQPLSGMVVQKGLARLLGTLVGTSMAVLFMALFAQAPWLFLLAMGLWLGLCTAASTLLRSAWSYTFVLAGYTVAIICLPLIGKPLLVFDQAVARCTEICLGILCATATSALLWPQRVERQMTEQASQTWQAGMQAVRRALGNEPHSRQGLLEVLGRIVAVDAQREHAWFEGERGRQRGRALRVLTRDLLGLLRLARGVARQWRQLEVAEAQGVAPWLAAVQAQLDEPQDEAIQQLRERLQLAAQDEALSPAQQFCLARLAVLLRQFLFARQALQAVQRGEAPADAPPALSWHRDLQTAAVYGLRSALAFLGLSTFWLLTAWPAASGALLLAAVVCSLFASRENADLIGMSFLRGIFYALPVAFVVGQLLLPQWSGFPLLCMALGVPLLFGVLGMARPAMAGTATSFCLHFIVLCAPQNDMVYDVASFLNQAIAMLIGVGCAVLAFRLITLQNPVWHGRRLLRATLDDLAALTTRTLAGADNWFGGRIADRLLQLARHYPVLPSETRSRWDDGVASLDLGDELLHLRACLAVAQVPLGEVERGFWLQLQQVLRAGPAVGLGECLGEPVAQLQQALQAQPPSTELRLAEAALLQLQGSWRQWCARQGETYGVA